MEKKNSFIKKNNSELRIKLLELGLIQSNYCNEGKYLSVNFGTGKFYQINHNPYKLNDEFHSQSEFLNHIANNFKTQKKC